MTLTQQDAEIDVGELQIHSNDPDTPMAVVEMLSGCKCILDLDVCALDGTVPAPEPFVDCVTDTMVGDPLIDFGLVSGADATRVVAIRNVAGGNSPLIVAGVELTNNTGLGDAYSFMIY